MDFDDIVNQRKKGIQQKQQIDQLNVIRQAKTINNNYRNIMSNIHIIIYNDIINGNYNEQIIEAKINDKNELIIWDICGNVLNTDKCLRFPTEDITDIIYNYQNNYLLGDDVTVDNKFTFNKSKFNLVLLLTNDIDETNEYKKVIRSVIKLEFIQNNKYNIL